MVALVLVTYQNSTSTGLYHFIFLVEPLCFIESCCRHFVSHAYNL